MTSRPFTRDMRGADRRWRRHLTHGTVWIMFWVLGPLVAAALWLSQGSVTAPDWVTTRVETALAQVAAGAGLHADLGTLRLELRDGLSPAARLEGLRLSDADGREHLALDEVDLVFDTGALLSGRLAPRAVRLRGARLLVARDAGGRLTVRLGDEVLLAGVAGPAQTVARLRAMLQAPPLSGLRDLGVEDLSVRLEDAGDDRILSAQGGALRLSRNGTALHLDLALERITPDGAVETPGRARLRLTSRAPAAPVKTEIALRGLVPAELAQIAGRTPLGAVLGRIDAPVSLDLGADFAAEGGLAALNGQLSVGAGQIMVPGRGAPVPMDFARAAVALSPRGDRLRLSDLELSAASLSLSGAVSMFLDRPAGSGGHMTAQLQFDTLRVDRPELFSAPLAFDLVAADASWDRDAGVLRLDGLVLRAEGTQLTGAARIVPGAGTAALDLAADRASVATLKAVWPLAMAPGTRGWVSRNLLSGTLRDVTAAIRLAPDARPEVGASFGFQAATLRPMAGLPPLEDASGRGTIQDDAFHLLVDSAAMTDPQGGAIALSQVLVRKEDMHVKGTDLNVAFHAEGRTGGVLGLLDLPVFSGARPATPPGTEPAVTAETATGRLDLRAELVIPLREGISVADVSYRIDGTATGFVSDRIVKGRRLEAGTIGVTVDPRGLQLAGPVRIGGAPVEIALLRPLGEGASGTDITASGALTPALLTALGVTPPPGTVSGAGRFDAKVRLAPDARPRLTATADLAGLGLRAAPLGWSKPAGAAGRAEIAASLGAGGTVERLSLSAPGLELAGRADLGAGGGVAALRLSRLDLGGWLSVAADLVPPGAGRAPRLSLTGGTMDLRRRPDGGMPGGGAGPGLPVDLRLDRVVLSDTVTLTDLRGQVSAGGSGRLTAQVGGSAPVALTVQSGSAGPSFRLTADDAGAVLRAAGLSRQARGGALDVRLVPDGGAGRFRGQARITDTALRNTPVLAELLAGISIVGAVEQMQGQGITFDDVRADFRLAPGRLTIDAASATGASLGLSLDGMVDLAGGRLDLQGVISPVYFLNRAGSFMTRRRGEGLIGMGYRLTGPIAAPRVDVNPLSVLMPGLLRDIFRNPDSGRVTRDAGQ